jgi:hypothetical protein
MRRQLPTILLVLSLPAGIVGYAIGAALVSALMPVQTTGLVGAFVALFIAGLCMVPFIVPALDRKAKEDLAAHRREIALEASRTAGDDTPEQDQETK